MNSSKDNGSQTRTGVLSVARKGVGYLSHPDEERDVEIQPDDLNTGMHGDQVVIRLHASKQGERQQGKVIEICERAKTTFVGTVVQEDKNYYLQPDDQRAYFKIRLPDEDAKDIEENTKVVVEMEEWDDPEKEPQGKITKTLGPSGVHEVEMQAVVIEHGFSLDFPPQVGEQAEEIKSKPPVTDADREKRNDFRDIPTFTIDPASAKDFDDALSVQFTDDKNIRVGIHIADVSHYVEPGTPIDKEARRRGVSVYLVDRTIHMLPEVLSQDVCSLNPNEEKLAFSAVFTLTPEGKVVDRWFGESLICSDKRFTYKEAQDTIDAGSGEFSKELLAVNKIAKNLRSARIKEGAIAFEQDEVVFDLADDGTPTSIHIKPVLETNKLIEEFMLLANQEVAFRIDKLMKESDNGKGALMYRVHDTPDSEKIEELATFVRAMGYEFDTNEGDVSAKELNRLFEKIEGSPEEQLIKTAAIRSMAKAVYSTKNIGHFGLSFEYYTHFTSPIRRYPDLLVHRLFKRHLEGEPIPRRDVSFYENVAHEVTELEIEASAAERESKKYKQVEYMQNHVGEEFDATISGVTDRGIFVKENTTHAEGMVRLGTLGNDYYQFEEGKYRLVGKDTKETFKLGDEVRVKLTGADLEERKLDFEILKKL